MSLSSPEVKALYDRYVVGNYGRAPLSLVRGEGSYVWDAEGRRYLDLLPGLGVNGLGHCPPRVVEAVRRQVGILMHVHNLYHWEQQAQLAKALVARTTGMGEAKVFFCNSGAEGSETGIKLARLWGKQHGGKWKFITLRESFHGRTFGALSATGQEALQKGSEPLVPGFTHVPINDAEALARAFDPETVAVVVEPVQGEGGIWPCTRAYLEQARALCDRHGALLLYDEVQSGMGRTGDWYAYQTLGAPAPDALWLAKALGGGFPIGALIARPELAPSLAPGTHGSTYGGNPLACAAALAVLETIEQERLLEHVRGLAERFGAGLRALRERHSGKVKEVRQVGLMAAVELHFPAAAVGEACREEGLLINVTHKTVLRFLPALTVLAGQLEEGLAILDRVLGR